MSEESHLTAEDILNAQKRMAKFIDPEAHCGTCRYISTSGDAKPCKDCFDSFMGIPMPRPSQWEKRAEDATETR
jgi:hypothetical protein